MVAGHLLLCGTILGVRLDVRRKYTPFVRKFETESVPLEFQAERELKVCVRRDWVTFSYVICVLVSSYSLSLSNIRVVP